MKFVGTCGFIVGSHHVIGGRREIAAFVFRTSFVGIVYSANTAFDVEETRISARLLCRLIEVIAEVVHKDTTEVAISAVASHVSGRTRPDGFLVELDLIHLNSAKKTGSEVTITQGE